MKTIKKSKAKAAKAARKEAAKADEKASTAAVDATAVADAKATKAAEKAAAKQAKASEAKAASDKAKADADTKLVTGLREHFTKYAGSTRYDWASLAGLGDAALLEKVGDTRSLAKALTILRSQVEKPEAEETKAAA